MRITGIIIRKEFRQIFRNRMMLPILFVMPFIQLIVLSFAATMEIRNIDLYVVDHDLSEASRELTDRFRAAGRFRLAGWSTRGQDATDALIRNEAKMALHIPRNFGRDLVREGSAPVQIVLDAVDGYSAGIAQQYAMAIINDYNQGRMRGAGIMGGAGLIVDFGTTGDVRSVGGLEPAGNIRIEYTHWYNPDLDFKWYMVPGILVLLVTMIGGFLSGMNIVREREIGTMEQINVTPIRKSQYIAGKLLPFWILALIELTFGLLVAALLFNVPMAGNLALVYLAAAVYLMGVLGMGLLVSTLTDTQQQAMFITWFIFVVFILLSGLFTPIDSMPAWAQKLTWLNPVAWFMDLMRRVLLAGAGLADVAKTLGVLALFALGMILLSVARYRKSTA